MSIHYKFKNSVEYDAVKFDGVYISASDLKAIIAQQKKLTNSGIQIMNEETGQVYSDDQLIPKNTNVITLRTPLANSSKRARMNNSHNNNNNSNPNSSGNTNGNTGNHHNSHYRNNGNHHHHSQPNASSSSQSHSANSSSSEAFELVSTKHMSEEEKIKQVQNQSTKDFDPSRYARGGGRGGAYRGGRGGAHRHVIHEGYKCRKCGIPGHSIYDCRNSLQPKVKKAHGIPRDFLMKADPKDKGALMTPSGEYAVPILDREAYSNPKIEKAPFFEEGFPGDDSAAGTATTTSTTSS